MTLGEKIQRLRNREGLSQEQLAEKIEVSRQSISKWELNQSTPDLEYIIQLSNIFEVSVDYLVKDEIENTEESISENTETEIKKSNYIKEIFADTVFAKIPFPFSIPVFIIISMFGFHKGWNWFGVEEPTIMYKMPIPIIITIIYLLLCFTGISQWHILWIIFLLIPIYYVIIDIFSKNLKSTKL